MNKCHAVFSFAVLQIERGHGYIYLVKYISCLPEEKMWLWCFAIRTPSSMCIIYMLVVLYVCSRNQLANIPPFVCQLQSLEVLHASNNRLVSLPEEIGRLEHLMDLVSGPTYAVYIPCETLQKIVSRGYISPPIIKLPYCSEIGPLLDRWPLQEGEINAFRVVVTS